MKTKLEIFTILPKITINWEIYIHFVKVFYTKVSRIRRLTTRLGYFLKDGTTLHLRIEVRCMHHTEHD